jgi:hypothetical protein
MVHVQLSLYESLCHEIEVPENTSQADLRMRASQLFIERVQTVPETFPLRDGTIVNCIPSFVPPTNHSDESKCAVVPYSTHQEKHYPIEVWPDIPSTDLANAASSVMGYLCCVHGSTRYPIQSKDEVIIGTEQDVHLEEIKLAALRQEDEIRVQSRTFPTMQQVFKQAPPQA